MIVADFINTMQWHKTIKTAVLSELGKVAKVELFDLYSLDMDLDSLKKTAVLVIGRLHKKNQKGIGRLYNTHTSHKAILTLSDQNNKAYQNELKKINEAN